MRIVVVHHALDAGGSARAAVGVANHYASRGHAVCLAGLARTGDWHYTVADEAETVELSHNPPLARSWKVFLDTVPKLRRLINSYRPDAVVSIGALPNFAAMAAVAGLGLPLIVSERADPSVMKGRRYPVLRNAVYRVRRADAFVVLTESTAEMVREWMPAERVHVIPNPAPRPERVRPPGGSGGRMVLAMGRLVPQKGFDVLLDAWARVVPDRPGWHLRIVGEGADRPELEAQTRGLGIDDSVEMPGFDPDPFAVMARAELFVLSSRYEGFGQVLVQAMACAVPVVATDCPSGPSEILRDGIDGILVPVEDAVALAGAMSKLMDDPSLRDEFGANARERAERFSPDVVWPMWDAVLDRVTAGRSGSRIA